MERKPAEKFQDLLVWQKAHALVLDVYRYFILSHDLGYAEMVPEALWTACQARSAAESTRCCSWR